MGFTVNVSPATLVMDSAKMVLGSVTTFEMGGMLTGGYLNSALSGLLASSLSMGLGLVSMLAGTSFFFFSMNVKDKAQLALQMALNPTLYEFIFKLLQCAIMAAAIALTSLIMNQPFLPLLGCWIVGELLIESAMASFAYIQNILKPEPEKNNILRFAERMQSMVM